MSEEKKENPNDAFTANLEIGDTVYWYDSLRSEAKIWPATVLNIIPGGLLQLNIHQLNRVMTRESAHNFSERTVKFWGAEELKQQGVWETKIQRKTRLEQEALVRNAMEKAREDAQAAIAKANQPTEPETKPQAKAPAKQGAVV